LQKKNFQELVGEQIQKGRNDGEVFNVKNKKNSSVKKSVRKKIKTRTTERKKKVKKKKYRRGLAERGVGRKKRAQKRTKHNDSDLQYTPTTEGGEF